VMTGTNGGTYERPHIKCSDCGRTTGKFSRIKDEWLCDECVEFYDMVSGGFSFPQINVPCKPFNPPKFVWGEPLQSASRKGKMA
jgi:hypothetical protein